VTRLVRIVLICVLDPVRSKLRDSKGKEVIGLRFDDTSSNKTSKVRIT